MSKKKIIKTLKSKGYEVEKATYTHPSGKLSDDFYEGGGWEIWVKGISLPILGNNINEVLANINKL